MMPPSRNTWTASRGRRGGIDIVFNAVGPLAGDYGNGKHAVDLTVEEYMVPLVTVVKSHSSRRAPPRAAWSSSVRA